MARHTEYDAVVVGSGPNGLAAAVTIAQAGYSVLVLEAKDTVGGGMRTLELTLPGFHHDICSAIHPLGIGSPFFRGIDLAAHGLEWIQPPIAVAHALDDGSAVALHRDLDATADSIGRDGAAWRNLLAPLVASWEELAPMLLSPRPWPRHPLALTQFGVRALWPAQWLTHAVFQHERARGLFGGLAGHAMLPLNQPLTASFGLILAMLGHAVGWPLPRRGSQSIAQALVALLGSLGGEVSTGHEVMSLAELPAARAVLLDVTPRQLVRLAGASLPDGYRRRLEAYRYGMGVFKIDYALDGPVPWRAQECRQAGTVHLGGTLREIAAAERAIWKGRTPERPFVLVAQQSLFDSTRAPDGAQTLWAYCHVPHHSAVDMTRVIEAQIERFAPGFHERILARFTHTALEMEEYNANYVGGNINGGVQDWRQLWTRPTLRWNPYRTPLPGVYLCSASTPPGGGVHGMCGYHAARSVLRDVLS